MISEHFAHQQRVAGVLYAEDFVLGGVDGTAEQPSVSEPDHVSASEVSIPLITQQDLDDAEAAGFARGQELMRSEYEKERFAWKSGTEHRLGEFLRNVDAVCDRRVGAAVEQMTDLVMRCASSMFPARMAKYGSEEQRAILERIKPMLRRATEITVFSSEKELAALSSYCSSSGAKQISACVDPDLLPGDFRIVWPQGQAHREAGKIAQALLQFYLPVREQGIEITDQPEEVFS